MLNHCLPILGILTRIPYNFTTNSNAFVLKTRNFPQNFIPLLESTWNLRDFEKKVEPQSLSIFETIHSKKGAYLSKHEVFSQNILGQSKCWRLPNTAQVCKNEYLLNISISLIYKLIEDVSFSHMLNLMTVC